MNAPAGEDVEMEPRKVRVDSIELLDWESPEAIIDIQCSSGTYVRSLIHDLGEKLGCEIHLGRLAPYEKWAF